MEAGTEPSKSKAKRSKGPTTVAREYFGAISDHDLDAAASMWKPGCFGQIVGMVELRVPGEYKQWFGQMLAAFPDFEFEILTIAASKEHAAVRWRATGTFNGTGTFEGMKPNGASIAIEGCDMLTIRDGRITENFAYLNGTDMARQLGAMPPAGSVAEKGMIAAFNAKTAAAKAIQGLRDR